MYQILLKRLFEAIKDDEQLALNVLEANPSLATMEWASQDKWIEGSTALHWAAHEGYLNLSNRLVSLGANVNADKGDWWCRPIDWACDSGQFTIAEFLIQQGAVLTGDKWSNCTPLHVVAQGGSTNGKENSDDYKKTALLLIQNGAEVNAIAKYGGQPPAMTPLDDAEKVGNEVVIEVLRTHGGMRADEL